MKNSKELRSQSGMTIIEMALGIALAGILGGSLVAMGILAIRASNLARMKAKALRYAEEGIEVVRRTRDEVSPSSIEDLLETCPEDRNCCIAADVLEACDGQESLGSAEEGGFFSRTIAVEEIEEGKALVTVEVSWGNEGKSVSLSTFLTAWAD